MMRVFVAGVGLRAPGLAGWHDGRHILAGCSGYEATEISVPAGDLLPPAERRRAIPSVRLALAAGVEAANQAACDVRVLTMVFATATGDPATIDAILETLASPEREVSPTRFQNSVYNAPAGYWSIATRSHQPSISLSAYDATASAGLLEAAVRATVEGCKVGLVIHDLPLLEPLSALRPIGAPFAAALILDVQADDRTFAALDIDFLPEARDVSRLEDAGLDALRRGTPAARILPVLVALARGLETHVVLEHTGTGRLGVRVFPDHLGGR